jgi:hypothetical protein
VLPLGFRFRFDVDAAVIGGVAHRSDCRHVVDATAEDVIHVFAGGVYLAEGCPRECPSCRPPFETLLTHQLERPLATDSS